jgi:glycosyl transferase family 25
MADLTPDIENFIKHYFDRVLVLTVHPFKERQERIKKALSGIPFDFFYGVYKNDLDAETISSNYVYDKNTSLAVRQVFNRLTKGELACAFSHRNIYQLILTNGWKRVLIIEDDAVPDFCNLVNLKETINELPPNWELFYLGYIKNEKVTLSLKLKHLWYKCMCYLGFSRLPLKMVKNILPKKFSTNLMKAGFHDCTHAYALTAGGAKKLIEAQTPVKYRADNLLTALVLKGKLNAFISKLQFFKQEIFINKTAVSFIRPKQKVPTE